MMPFRRNNRQMRYRFTRKLVNGAATLQPAIHAGLYPIIIRLVSRRYRCRVLTPTRCSTANLALGRKQIAAFQRRSTSAASEGNARVVPFDDPYIHGGNFQCGESIRSGFFVGSPIFINRWLTDGSICVVTLERSKANWKRYVMTEWIDPFSFRD